MSDLDTPKHRAVMKLELVSSLKRLAAQIQKMDDAELSRFTRMCFTKETYGYVVECYFPINDMVKEVAKFNIIIEGQHEVRPVQR